MATDFSVIEAKVRKDTSLVAAGDVSSDDIANFIRAAYHEVFHKRPDLRAQFNETTGVLTRLDESLDLNATELPDFFDNWFLAIEHYVKWRMLTMFRMDAAQIARARIEEQSFLDEVGTPAIPNK